MNDKKIREVINNNLEKNLFIKADGKDYKFINVGSEKWLYEVSENVFYDYDIEDIVWHFAEVDIDSITV